MMMGNGDSIWQDFAPKIKFPVIGLKIILIKEVVIVIETLEVNGKYYDLQWE